MNKITLNNNTRQLLEDYLKQISKQDGLMPTKSKILESFVKLYRDLSKNQIMAVFEELYKDLPKQGSKEWKNNRVIGGSDINKLLDTNSGARNIIEGLLKVTDFHGSDHTRWGHLFENVISTIIDILTEGHTVETGSIPGMTRSDGKIIQTFSPDGLLLCKTVNIKKLILHNVNYCNEDARKLIHNFKDDESIILLEFKSPSADIPTSYVRDSYTYQPLTGLNTISIADFSVYIDTMFRKCSIDDFDFTMAYDDKYLVGKNEKVAEKRKPTSPPIMIGFVGLYEKFENPIKYDIDIDFMVKEIYRNVIAHIKNKLSIYYGLIPDTLGRRTKLLTLVNQTLFTYIRVNNMKLTDTHINIIMSEVYYQVSNERIETSDIADFRLSCIDFEFNVLDYGIDMGHTNCTRISKLLERYKDDQNTVNGIKEYIVQDVLTCEELQEIYMPKTNTILIDKLKWRQWLYLHIRSFIDHCLTNGYKPIGILPWKIFKISMVPVIRQDNFLESNRKKIEETFDIVDKIKNMMADMKLEPDNHKEYCIKELDKIFGKKREYKPRSVITDFDYSDVISTPSNEDVSPKMEVSIPSSDIPKKAVSKKDIEAIEAQWKLYSGNEW